MLSRMKELSKLDVQDAVAALQGAVQPGKK